tara:strand:+ start:2487 stop:3035 length:549 start_codon:yes stop_codon:yes gene_type:complete
MINKRLPKLILLDRDGVINFDSEDYIKTESEWVPIPESISGLSRLHAAGYLLGVCSNQSAVARGLLSVSSLAAIELKMIEAIDAAGAKLECIFYCQHHPNASCECRKPKPGLLLAAMSSVGVSPQETMFVGDSLSDIEAAEAAGCTAVLVRTGNGELTEREISDRSSIIVTDNLVGLANLLI